jgi:hypothetical protein
MFYYKYKQLLGVTHEHDLFSFGSSLPAVKDDFYTFLKARVLVLVFGKLFQFKLVENFNYYSPTSKEELLLHALIAPYLFLIKIMNGGGGVALKCLVRWVNISSTTICVVKVERTFLFSEFCLIMFVELRN